MTSRLITSLSLCILALVPGLSVATNIGVDGSFGPDSGHYRFNRDSSNESVHDVALDSQGRILLAFFLEDAGNPGTYWPAAMRLTSSGYGDPSFGFLGIWVESTIAATPECVVAISVHSSDRPIIGWTYEFDQVGTLNRDWYIRRLTSAGAPDTGQIVAFDIGINQSGDRLDQLTDLKVLSDGRIVAVGGAQYNGADWDFAIGVLKDNGSGGLTLDSAFDVDGRRTIFFDLAGSSNYDNAAAVTTDSTDNIVIVGWSHSSAGNVVSVSRVDKDTGAFDPSFDGDGKANYSYSPIFDPSLPARGVEVASLTQGIVIGAVLNDVSFNRIGVLRVNSDGSVDLSFGANGWFYKNPTYPDLPFSSASTTLTGVAVDNDRLVYSATIEDPLDPSQSMGMVVITSLSGSPDTSFSPSGLEYYMFEPDGEATGTGFSAVVIPGIHLIGESVGKAVLVGSMRGVTAGASRSDNDLMATQIYFGATLFTDGFENGGTSAWSSTVGGP